MDVVIVVGWAWSNLNFFLIAFNIVTHCTVALELSVLYYLVY